MAGDGPLRRPSPPSPRRHPVTRCERMGQEGAWAREDHHSSSGQPPPSLSGRGALAEMPAPAPSRQASRGPPFCAQQPGADANRNAWTAEIDSCSPQETTGGPAAPFPECPHLLFCAHKCHPIAEAAEAELQAECLPGALASGLSARAVRPPRLQYQPSSGTREQLQERLGSWGGNDLSCEAEEFSLPGAF